MNKSEQARKNLKNQIKIQKSAKKGKKKKLLTFFLQI